MKKFLLIAILIFIVILGCKKKNDSATDNKTDDASADTDQIIQYINTSSCFAYKIEDDLGKTAKETNEIVWLKFGNSVNVIKSKKNKDILYYKIQLPDGSSDLWIEAKYLAKKFIIINQYDTKCYSSADESYPTAIRLQPGDFGVFMQESKNQEWIKVSFYAYRPFKEGEERKWVGEKWIKTGYTDDIILAREAYYLYRANYSIISEKSNANAIKVLEEIMSLRAGEPDTEITTVIKNLLEELKNKKTEDETKPNG